MGKGALTGRTGAQVGRDEQSEIRAGFSLEPSRWVAVAASAPLELSGPAEVLALPAVCGPLDNLVLEAWPRASGACVQAQNCPRTVSPVPTERCSQAGRHHAARGSCVRPTSTETHGTVLFPLRPLHEQHLDNHGSWPSWMVSHDPVVPPDLKPPCHGAAPLGTTQWLLLWSSRSCLRAVWLWVSVPGLAASPVPSPRRTEQYAVCRIGLGLARGQ